jgi:inositol-phosphate phosphatase / L-galactose 1-phosphate phosphatase / histidinol-phosphatase
MDSRRRRHALKNPALVPDLNDCATFACHLADIARGMLTDASGHRPDMEVKPDRSFVTALDREIEQRLRRLIATRYPAHGIIGEEEGAERPEASIQWVLDPIDGTAPFIAGVPVYGTLIALAVDGVPNLGIMDLPAAGHRWVGVAGRPTTLNGTPCRTRPCPSLDRAIMACMNPDFFDAEERLRLDALKAATSWRIYGTSSMGYGLLAAGRIDVAMDTRLQSYDYACYRPIIEGAGGVVTDWAGEPVTLSTGRRILAAGDASLHERALDTIGRA